MMKTKKYKTILTDSPWKYGKRFDATRLGYMTSQWVGDKEYKGSCIGCFWYDPSEFNAQVSSKFKRPHS